MSKLVETDIFDRQATSYDAWYDTPAGSALLAEEIEALRPLMAGLPRPWLEVGVGTGRFAAALGVEVGIDPAPSALRLAAGRGVLVAVAPGEQLPFPAATFGAILFALTLCFLADPLAVLGEARRVLRPEGGLVLGLIPAEGPFGQQYRARAAAGHAYYSKAHFYTRRELRALLAAAGLQPVCIRSALFGPAAAGRAREGDHPTAGFTALLAAADRGQQPAG